jgi:putative acetyltransferase
MVNIRSENRHDIAGVRRVHVAAFPTAAEADLVDRLRASGKSEVSLVAEMEGQIVGHIVFSRVTFNPPLDFIAYALGPMAVTVEHQRYAVGRRLVQNGLAECHNRDACMVVVDGDSEYYSRFGFERAYRHGLSTEFKCKQCFLVFMFDAFAHPPPLTLIKYASEFESISMPDSPVSSIA